MSDKRSVEEGAVSFSERLASSQHFAALFRDGMALVDETASYLDGSGRLESKKLERGAGLVYATESLRLTNRLMHLASWLLLHRAVKEGEITLLLGADRPAGLMQGYQGDDGKLSGTDGALYRSGDVVFADEEGYLTFVGRSDDVFKSSDYRISPFELESVLIEHEAVAEAAVVPVVDEIKGRVPEVYIALQPGLQPSHEVTEKVNKAIETIIGKIARPKNIHIVPDMPKTRSGKLMRRVLASISNRMNTGDITTLANPDVVEKVRELVQGKEPVAVADGPEDLKQFGKDE